MVLHTLQLKRITPNYRPWNSSTEVETIMEVENLTVKPEREPVEVRQHEYLRAKCIVWGYTLKVTAKRIDWLIFSLNLSSLSILNAFCFGFVFSDQRKLSL